MVASLVRSRDDMDVAALADAAVSQWVAIGTALAPIIGDHGVAALYHRSLFMAVKAHPWLEHQRSPTAPGIDLLALRALLVRQDAAEVCSATVILHGTFMDLLASLVGAPLAERLLGPLWTRRPAGSCAQPAPT